MDRRCDPQEVALKSMFLGPQAENGPWVMALINEIFENWFTWRRSLFPEDGTAISSEDQGRPEFLERRAQFRSLLLGLMRRFEDEIPKFSPRYIGHMLSETSLPALLGHVVTLLHNPNNVSGEASRVGVQIEDEAIAALLSMVGYPASQGAGHFTSGGTIANLEALVRARQRLALWVAAGAYLRVEKRNRLDLIEAAHMGWRRFDGFGLNVDLGAWNISEGSPIQTAVLLEKIYGRPYREPVVLVPDHKHYSWSKAMTILGLGNDALWPIELDAHGKLSIPALQRGLQRAVAEGRPVLMVVSVAGTTEMGGVDPIGEVQMVLDRYRGEQGLEIWHHVDAAFGGFFCCLDSGERSPLSRRAARGIAAIRRTNSVTIDPHKMGYVPYSSGCFLVNDKRDYFLKPAQVPYIDFKNAMDRGPFTIEGSRSAAGAVATWMTANSIGLNPEGYGRIISRTVQIREQLEAVLQNSGLPIQIAPFSDTNILCFTVTGDQERISTANQRTKEVFEALSGRAKGEFFVSKTSLAWRSYREYLDKFVSRWNPVIDAEELYLIRMCTMNPFFNSKEISADYPRLFIESLRRALA